MEQGKGIVRITVVKSGDMYLATSLDAPGVSYSSRNRITAIQSFRAHILREEASQTILGSASPWVNAVLPVVDGDP